MFRKINPQLDQPAKQNTNNRPDWLCAQSFDRKDRKLFSIKTLPGSLAFGVVDVPLIAQNLQRLASSLQHILILVLVYDPADFVEKRVQVHLLTGLGVQLQVKMLRNVEKIRQLFWV